MNIIKYSSPHFNDRALPINTVIIHYTAIPTAEETRTWFCNPGSKVSAHYLIDEKGQIYQFVEEDKRAWHAGESYWQGCTDINSCSIGIELVNPGHSHNYRPFPEAQIDALIRLCDDIRTRWDIPGSRILGHSDIAPRRKQDPGHLFPWKQLAKKGLGLWPDAVWIASPTPWVRDDRRRRHYEGAERLKHSSINLTEGLAKIGYETLSLHHTILAFQRHFQPHKLDGIADQETFSLLQALL